MKFTFVSENSKDLFTENSTKRTVEFECEFLDDIIQEFELFLKGSGYQFDRIVVEDDISDFDDDYGMQEEVTNNEFEVEIKKGVVQKVITTKYEPKFYESTSNNQ
jgi:hypothetical protein